MGRMTQADFRSEVEANLGNRSIGNTRVDRWIYWAIDEITGVIEFESLMEVQTLTTTADTESVALEADTLGVLGVMDITNDNRLIRTSRERILQMDEELTGDPKLWARWGGNLILRPIPDGVFDLRVLSRNEHVVFATDADTTDLPATWDVAITMLATHYAYMSLEELDRAMTWFNRAMAYIRSRLTDDSMDADATSEPLRVIESYEGLIGQQYWDHTL